MPFLDYNAATIPADEWSHMLDVEWWPTWKHNYWQKPTFTGWLNGQYYFWRGDNYCIYSRTWGASVTQVGSQIDFYWLDFPTVFDSDAAIGHSMCQFQNPVVAWRCGVLDRLGIGPDDIAAAYSWFSQDVSGTMAKLDLDTENPPEGWYTEGNNPPTVASNLYGVNWNGDTALDSEGHARALLQYSLLGGGLVGINMIDTVKAMCAGRAYDGMAFIAGSQSLNISGQNQNSIGPEFMYNLWSQTYKRNITHDESTQITHGTIEASIFNWTPGGLGTTLFALSDSGIALPARARVTPRPVKNGWS